MTTPLKVRQAVADLIRQNIAALDGQTALHVLFEIESDVEDMRRELQQLTRSKVA
jgi:hypothetical protein